MMRRAPPSRGAQINLIDVYYRTAFLCQLHTRFV